jgi:alkylated DNA repair dioxygenase AlkB
MKLWRRKVLGMLALTAVMLLPATALAHDNYDDPWQNHPFKIAAEGAYIVAFTVDRLVLRPIHWMTNSKPGSTVTGHDKMNRRPPPDDLEDLH